MAASKSNYLIIYKESAQTYSATSLATAVKTPLPKGCSMEGRQIGLMTYLPDEESLCFIPLTAEQIAAVEIPEKPKEEEKAPEQIEAIMFGLDEEEELVY
jgi:hypothetical protein